MQRPQDKGRFAMASNAHFDMMVGTNHLPLLCNRFGFAPAHHAGTVANNDQLDLLAEWMGVGQQVAALTNSVRRWLVMPGDRGEQLVAGNGLLLAMGCR